MKVTSVIGRQTKVIHEAFDQKYLMHNILQIVLH